MKTDSHQLFWDEMRTLRNEHKPLHREEYRRLLALKRGRTRVIMDERVGFHAVAKPKYPGDLIRLDRPYEVAP